MKAPLIAYVMSRFPKITETFILREILEMQRQGQSILVFPLIREKETVIHEESTQILPLVHFTPFLAPGVVWCNLRFFCRKPRLYLKTAWMALEGCRGSWSLLVGAIGIFPKSVCMANKMLDLGVRHVHAHFATHPALAALIISEFTGIGFSFTAHAHDIFVRSNMLRQKINRARVVITISDFNKRYLLEKILLIPDEKIRVVRCGVDPDHYRRKREEATGNSVLEILNVGSLQPSKGTADLIGACKTLQRSGLTFRCRIVGEGKLKPQLQRLIKKLGLVDEVQLLGALDQQQVASLLEEADIFVLPSVVADNGQMEGIPVAIMEAMAARLPVVASRLSGIPELVRHGDTGLLIEPGEVSSQAAAIAQLARSPKERRRMGSSGRELVREQFNLKTNVGELIKQLHTVMESNATERSGEGHAGPLSGRAGEELDLKKLHAGGDSELFELGTNHDRFKPADLVLKLHRPKYCPPSERLSRGRTHARNEYKALAFLWPRFVHQSKTLGVPRPLEFLECSGGIVMEKIKGQRLDQQLRWKSFNGTNSSMRRLEKIFESSGEWLATFHTITEQKDDPHIVFPQIEKEFGKALRRVPLSTA